MARFTRKPANIKGKMQPAKQKWDLSTNAVAIPYLLVPRAGFARRTSRQVHFTRKTKYLCPACKEPLMFSRTWSKKPQRLEILVPICQNKCNLAKKWFSAANQLRSPLKKPGEIKKLLKPATYEDIKSPMPF